jgi:hypothetical protein
VVQLADNRSDALGSTGRDRYPDMSHAINGEYPDRIANDVGPFLTGKR